MRNGARRCAFNGTDIVNQHTILLEMGLGPIWIAKNPTPKETFIAPIVAAQPASEWLDTPAVIITDMQESHSVTMTALALEKEEPPNLATQPNLHAAQISKMNAEQLANALSILAPTQKMGEGNQEGRLLILLEQDYSQLDNLALQLLQNILKAAQYPIESVYFSSLNKIPDDTELNQAILRQQIQLSPAEYILSFSAEPPQIENSHAWINAPSLSNLQQASAKAALWQQLCLLDLSS